MISETATILREKNGDYTHHSRIETHISSCPVCLTPLSNRFRSQHLNSTFKIEDENLNAPHEVQQVQLEVRRSK